MHRHVALALAVVLIVAACVVVGRAIPHYRFEQLVREAMELKPPASSNSLRDPGIRIQTWATPEFAACQFCDVRIVVQLADPTRHTLLPPRQVAASDRGEEHGFRWQNGWGFQYVLDFPEGSGEFLEHPFKTSGTTFVMEGHTVDLRGVSTLFLLDAEGELLTVRPMPH